MKKLIKLILFIILILLISIFYKIHFIKDEIKIISNDNNNQKDFETSKQNSNLIKNLKYNISLDENNKYTIESDLGEISFNEEGQEIIEMKKTKAIFIDKNDTTLIVTSNFASYNTSNQNIIFYDMVNIKYLDKIIFSQQVKFDHKKQLLTLSNNVSLKDMNTEMSADNIKISLISKKIEIYMNDEKDVININSNYR